MIERRTLLAVVAAAATGLAAQSVTAQTATAQTQHEVREIELKDGTVLLIFRDGKMSMRDRNGRPLQMKEGHPMEAKDGKVYMMRGNEVWRRTEREEMYRGGN